MTSHARGTCVPTWPTVSGYVPTSYWAHGRHKILHGRSNSSLQIHVQHVVEISPCLKPLLAAATPAVLHTYTVPILRTRRAFKLLGTHASNQHSPQMCSLYMPYVGLSPTFNIFTVALQTAELERESQACAYICEGKILFSSDLLDMTFT